MFVFCTYLLIGQNTLFDTKNTLLNTNTNSWSNIFVGNDINSDNKIDFFGLEDSKLYLYLSKENSYEKVSISDKNDFPIAIMDFDGDGHLDLLTDELYYYLNNGSNQFEVKSFDMQKLANYYNVYQDFDGDKRIDILSLNSQSFSNGYLLIDYKKSGSGYQNTILDNTVPSYGYVKTVDIDNDGVMDIAAINNNTSYLGVVTKNIMLFRNKLNKSFTKKIINLNSSLDINANNLDVVDMDNDSDVDILFSVKNNGLYLLENQAGNYLAEKRINEFNVLFSKSSDIDYDGDMDIVFIENSGGEVGLYYQLNIGNLEFSTPQLIDKVTGYISYWGSNPNEFEKWFFLYDIDKDKAVDVVLNAPADKKIVWFKNKTQILPVSITKEPIGSEFCENKNILIEIEAKGTLLKFQWQKDGINILNEKSSKLIIDSLHLSDSGSYRCIVNGYLNSDTSAVAMINVLENISILKDPLPLILKLNENASFKIEYKGVVSGFQWYKDGVKLTNGTKYSGATSSELKIVNVSETDKGSYHCVITGPCGSVTSVDVTLNVTSAVQDDLTEKIIVFPNPATNVINIETADFTVSELELKDNLGRVVKSMKNSDQMNISDIQQGLYSLTVRTKETKIVKKIIISR